MADLISLNKVSARYQRQGSRVVKAVSSALHGGLLTVLVGENGSGKSSLLKLLAGVLRPTEGSILLQGQPMEQWSRAEQAKWLSYLPQRGNVDWPLPAIEVVRLAGLARRDWSQERLDEAVRSAMIQTDSWQFRERSCHQLSSGELQRVLLARAMASEPRVLLADEPTAGLDPRHQLACMQQLRTLSRQGVAVLTVLHDLQLARQFADRVWVLQEGVLIADGNPSQTLSPEQVSQVFGI